MDFELMKNGNVRIGMKAPEFEAMSTMGIRKMSDYKGKWLVFFSHPGDFTPVCTTEIIAFSKAFEEFESLNTNLLGLSVDSNNSHLEWLYEIYCRTGVRVPFPIIDDRTSVISRLYGMIAPDVDSTQTVRNVFIIDDNGIVRAIFVYPMEIGRCIPEILRTICALQVAKKNDASMPANWMVGEPGIMNKPNTYNELEERINFIQENRNGLSWYLSFKDLNLE